MSLPEGLKATPYACMPTAIDGFAYLVPNPELHGYTETYGATACAIAMALPEGLKATPRPMLGIATEGSAYLVPNPELHG